MDDLSVPPVPRPFVRAEVVEDFIRLLLQNRFPPDWLERLVYEDMVRVPDTWVEAQWRCADVVASIPLRPDGPEPQPTHRVVAVKLARSGAPQLHDRLRRQVALLEREFVRRCVFGAPAHPPLVTAVVVQGRTMPKGPRAARPKPRVVRWGAGAVRFVR